MACLRCEVTRAKVVAHAKLMFGVCPFVVTDELNKALPGEYFIECDPHPNEERTFYKITRRNMVAPFVDYVIAEGEFV